MTLVWPLVAQILLNGDPLVVRTNARFAGAIHSITWRGVQFVDAYDHGRELQTALHFDRSGECWNPTEAGSKDDGAGHTSTSVVIADGQADDASFWTLSNPAFWNRPGGTSTGCRTGATNTTLVSDVVLRKTVTIVAGGLITYDAVAYVAQTHERVVVEAPVLYVPRSFSRIRYYDPVADRFYPWPDDTRLSLPLVASSTAGFASGIWSPGAKMKGFRFFNANAIDALRIVEPVPVGRIAFRTYIAIGTVPTVKAALARVYEP